MENASYDIERVYCHGLPGSAAEIADLIPEGCAAPFVLSPLDFDGYDEAVLRSKTGKVHIIGFSLGAMTALRIVALRPEIISRVSLIAPAAPLELGNFLPHMAGRPVFSAAMKGRIPFAIFTAFQRLGFKLAPKQMVNTMFAGSPKADIELLSSPRFQHALLGGIGASLGKGRRSYMDAVQAYVQPWSEHLKKVSCPVTLYHGADDNWAPIEMARALEQEIGSNLEMIVFEKLGHYSALQKALPLILRHRSRAV